MIKKHKNKNVYKITEDGIWVRDFTKPSKAIDVNSIIKTSDYKQFIFNEMNNAAFNLPSVDSDILRVSNVIIVSDGLDFKKKKHVLKDLDAVIIGVNGALNHWTEGKMDYYVVNNPYSSCMSFFPKHKYMPRCITSLRTFPDFIRKYVAHGGDVYSYACTPNENFIPRDIKPRFFIDDYRNPICAAISLAFRWNVEKLVLFCCDDSFYGDRPGAIHLFDEIYTYPQHLIAHRIIDSMLYWMMNQEFNLFSVANCSFGPLYNNIENIKEEKIKEFLK